MIDSEASVNAAISRQNYHGMDKTWEDCARYVRIINETKPEVIVETGTYLGGSSRWFSQFADVISVDVVRRNDCIFGADVTYLLGDSTHPDTFNKVKELVAGRRTLVSLDSDHSELHVWGEMNLYSTLVHDGDYMVVEDGIVRDWMGHRGPCDSIERFMGRHSDKWIIDMDIEDMFPVTLFPMGWMRRKAS